jgi:serine/threonine protein kinase
LSHGAIRRVFRAMLRGQTFKGYEIHESIGQGAFGAVYRAHQTVVDLEVAIKVILPQYAYGAKINLREETSTTNASTVYCSIKNS